MDVNTVGVLCSVVNSFAAMATTILAAKSLKYNYNQQNELYQREEKRKLLDYNMLWYNEIVLKDILYGLNDYIEKTNSILAEFRKSPKKEEKCAEQVYDEIKSYYDSTVEKIYILKIFNNELFKDCEKSIQEMLDIYTEIVETFHIKHIYSNYKQNTIQKIKVELSRKLLQYGRKLIEDSVR